MTRPSALFFARVPDKRLLDLLEFYREDLRCLEVAGYPPHVEHRAVSAMFQPGDVLYAWWWPSALPVVVAWRLRGKPCIVTGATAFRDVAIPGPKRVLRNVLTRLCARVATRNLAISDFELEDLAPSAPRSSSALYLAVDTDFFRPGPKNLRPTAITVGQVNPFSIRRKGIDLAIACTSLVRQTLPDFVLNVVGPVSSDGAEWIRDARKKYDFTGVNILGEVSRDDKRDLLSSAWVYLQPSIYEAFGLAVAEALACGTPAICSNGGALSEVIGRGGIVVGSRTADAIATAVVNLFASPLRLHIVATAARDRASSFSRTARAGGLARLLEELGL